MEMINLKNLFCLFFINKSGIKCNMSLDKVEYLEYCVQF